MTKSLIESKIAGRADRKRLAVSSTPYWRGIDPEVHLGYRKGKRGGVWLVRWRHGEGYRQRTLGVADDELREGTLDFEAAARAARELIESERRNELAIAGGSLLTVGSVVRAYVVARDTRETARRGRPVLSDANSRLTRYILGREAAGRRKAIQARPLAAIPLHSLLEGDLIAWRDSLPEELKGATKRRLANDLKAALNDAYAAHRNRLPSTFPAIIKHGLSNLAESDDDRDDVARGNQILTDRQVASLLNAAQEVDAEQGWEGDLFRLVAVLAATGSRFSQVARLRVGDVQAEAFRLMVPTSRKGRGGKHAHTPVPIGEDILKALMPAILDRPKSAPLLERWRSKQAAGSIKWEKVDRGPWESASQLTRAWNAIRTRAELPTVIAYALRHSSIVRGIRQNLPVRLVAALHDTSVAMIERHYGRYIAHGLDELAARAVVPLIGHTDGPSSKSAMG